MSNDKTYIPKTLDDPARWLFWTLDEVVIFLIPFVVGILSSHVLLSIVIGALGIMGLKRLKGREGQYVILQAVYWYLPFLKLQSTPASMIREWVG
jgi:conjugal transfer pilus assembly protein TraL